MNRQNEKKILQDLKSHIKNTRKVLMNPLNCKYMRNCIVSFTKKIIQLLEQFKMLQVYIMLFRVFITLQRNINTILIMISTLLFNTIEWVLFIMQWHIKKCSRLAKWMKL